MKIVAISASQIPSSVANSIQAMKAVHALAQLGHDVTLLAPSHPEPQRRLAGSSRKPTA
jgi:hypothetical protein